jgi:hypothetical protein
MGLNNWIGEGREVVCNMMIEQIGGKDPFAEMSPVEFRKFFGGWRLDYPFLAWMHHEHNNDEAQNAEYVRFMGNAFINHLKDAEAYNEHWKKYENYGKEADNAEIQKATENGESSALGALGGDVTDAAGVKL